VNPNAPETSGGKLVSIDKVLECLQRIDLNKDIAVNAVQAYKDAFAAGYGYYFYNDAPLLSDPLSNPYGWEIFNGTSGGQVNYAKEFDELIADIKKNGSDGTLSYKISDIITQARDFHSDQVSWDLSTLGLVHVSPDPVIWLNLRVKEGSSDVEVVGNVVGPDGTGVAETKVVSMINGQDALEFLKGLTSDTAIGYPSQFRSPGVRMNTFLGAQETDDGFLRWSNAAFPSTGDITKLPSRLEIVYEDGTSTTWAFAITVPEDLAFLPVAEVQTYLNKPAGGSNGPLALYNNMVEGKPAPNEKKTTRGRTSPSRRDVVLRDYYIYPGFKDNDTNLLEFTVFKDRSVNPPVTFSGFTVVNEDTMVWKLPTFANPKTLEDVINFWNVMVNEAKEKNIKKLIIDISDNTGGSIANAYTAVGLLYPDAPFEDVVHWYTTRISDVMLTLGREALPEFQSIMEQLTLDENKQVLASYVNETDVEDLKKAFLSMFQILTNAGLLAVSTGNCDAEDFSPSTLVTCLSNGGNNENWVNVNYQAMSDILETANELLNSEEGFEDGLDEDDVENFFAYLNGLKESINRPGYCQNLNETCKTQTNKQGGVSKVLSSDYFRSTAMDSDILRQVREFSQGNPFESYVLFSNAQTVGSAANIFESALRHISKKYNDAMPKTTGVSLGCLGDASQCAMTSFQGQIAQGSKFLGSLYAMYGVLSTLEQFLNLLPDSLVSELKGISKKDIKNYEESVEKYLSELPKPPSISSALPQYNSCPIYSLDIPRQTIPQEFFNRPPDEYLAIWPAPGSTTFGNQKSLPLIYEGLQKFF